MGYIATHPNLACLVTAMTVLRTIFKPAMAVLEAGVQASGNANAIKVLSNVEASKFYKTVCFAVDYLSGIKLPVVAAKMAVSSSATTAPTKT